MLESTLLTGQITGSVMDSSGFGNNTKDLSSFRPVKVANDSDAMKSDGAANAVDDGQDDVALAEDPVRAAYDRLIAEHRSLDDQIETMRGSEGLADIEIQRLKKRKLGLKDQIMRVKAMMVPDITA